MIKILLTFSILIIIILLSRFLKHLTLLTSVLGILSSVAFFVFVAALNSAGDGGPNRSSFAYYFPYGVLLAIASYIGMMVTVAFNGKILSDIVALLVCTIAVITYLYLGDLSVIIGTSYLVFSFPWICHYLKSRHFISIGYAVILSVLICTLPIIWKISAKAYKHYSTLDEQAARKVEIVRRQKEDFDYHSKYAKQYLPLIWGLREYHRENKVIMKEDVPLYKGHKGSYVDEHFNLKRFTEICKTLTDCRDLNLYWDSHGNDSEEGTLRSETTRFEARIVSSSGAEFSTDGNYLFDKPILQMTIKPTGEKSAYIQFRLDENSEILCGKHENRTYNDSEVLPCSF